MATSPQSRQKRAIQGLAHTLREEGDAARELSRWLYSLPDEKIYEFVAYLDMAWGLLGTLMDMEKYLRDNGDINGVLGNYIRVGMEQGLLWPLSPEAIEAVKPTSGEHIETSSRLKIVPLGDVVMMIPSGLGNKEGSTGDE